MELHRRSMAKVISWRLAATFITASIAWVITGEFRFAAAIGIADSLVKIGAYYLHERLWGRIRFGRTEA